MENKPFDPSTNAQDRTLSEIEGFDKLRVNKQILRLALRTEVPAAINSCLSGRQTSKHL